MTSVRTSIDRRTGRSSGAWLLIAGAVTMLAGAVTFAAHGADLDAALASGEMADYLTDVAGNSAAVRVNLGLWITGVILMGLGGNVLSRAGDTEDLPSAAARFCFTAGPAVGIAAFSIWLGIVDGLAPAHASGIDVLPTATALGQAASIADWVATFLIIGVGAFALASSGQGTWASGWLYRWGQVAMVAGVVSIASLAFFDRSALGLNLFVPIGIGFVLATGIVAARGGN